MTGPKTPGIAESNLLPVTDQTVENRLRLWAFDCVRERAIERLTNDGENHSVNASSLIKYQIQHTYNSTLSLLCQYTSSEINRLMQSQGMALTTKLTASSKWAEKWRRACLSPAI